MAGFLEFIENTGKAWSSIGALGGIVVIGDRFFFNAMGEVWGVDLYLTFSEKIKLLQTYILVNNEASRYVWGAIALLLVTAILMNFLVPFLVLKMVKSDDPSKNYEIPTRAVCLFASLVVAFISLPRIGESFAKEKIKDEFKGVRTICEIKKIENRCGKYIYSSEKGEVCFIAKNQKNTSSQVICRKNEDVYRPNAVVEDYRPDPIK